MPVSLDLKASGGRQPVVFRWAVNSLSGWGIYGLNLALHLAGDRRFAPVGAAPWNDVVLDPVRSRALAQVRDASRALSEALSGIAGDVDVNAPVLHPLGNDLEGDKRFIAGPTNAGVIFMTGTAITAAGRQRAQRYNLIVAGSEWNARLLREGGVDHVVTVLQGVDPGLFHPAPTSGLLADRFVIFSGGKLEFRKGQDLVLTAFRAFHARHPEALLLTAWQSGWPHLAARFDVPPPLGSNGTIDVTGWAAAQGLPADAVVDVGMAPNISMPHVMREADVALFPNRAEGGTNLVAMECMACGVPVILSANTGHLDLLRDDAAMPLRRQRAVVRGIDGTDGWGESDVEEMLEALETLWSHRAWAKELGARGAAAMAGLTWRGQIGRLMEALEPVLG